MLFWEPMFLTCFLFGLNDSDSLKPVMYLCLDSMMQKYQENGKPPSKLVYGYINGKKTDCMSEYELRARFSESEFKAHRASEIDSEKILETSGQKRVPLPLSLKDAVFKGKKDLAGVDLRGYDLKGVDLSGADLHNANLESADLRNSNLSNANLSGASLEFAFLKNANLKHADLSNASLKSAYFQNANFSNVKGLTLDHIRSTTTVFNATFDSDMMALIKEYCSNKLKDPGWQWQSTIYASDSVIPEGERAQRKQFH